MSEYQQNLWAPWRMEYIASLNPTGSDECFLCRAHSEANRDAENLVLWRGAHTLTLLNRFPYSSGHVLIAPAQHHAQPEELSEGALLELMQRVRDVKRVLETALHAQGFNIGMNLGHCAGAGLPGHLHMHVVPRWSGDTNFMAVLVDVKVIPESLAAVQQRFQEVARTLGLP